MKLWRIQLENEYIEYVNAPSFSKLLEKLTEDNIVTHLDSIKEIKLLYTNIK